MPELSRFFGLLIKIQFDDHAPPHIHVWYSGRPRARFRIHDATLLSGKLPRTHMAAVIFWMGLHRVELMEAWNLAKKRQKPGKIDPLCY